ncbi:hypothetical protein [Christiangramia sp.]|uniref:hypothetical protein n=1 Tax=Christiangramia sp. TaxID=1931228 RepID=UPI00260B150E|nr:hypothetical protein [Christiangramia sp.]
MKQKCSKCNHEVNKDMKNCPNCDADLTKQRKIATFGCLGFVLIAIIIGIWFFSGESETPQLTDAEKRVQHIENCLSAWDGSHPELEERIKSSLNDEESYEHIETRYLDNDSSITLITKFSAKNSFGGTLKKDVIAEINNNCELIEIIQWYE